ncbi:MAG: DUF4438 domain-containing protein [candidate division WOR-3 bacterium]
MIKTNKEKLVMIAVQGEISHPLTFYPYDVSRKGEVIYTLPEGCLGIHYNVKVGDSAFGWQADHIEPGVTVVFSQKEEKREEFYGFRIPVCIGNIGKVISGEAKGEKGIVTGIHTGILVDFPQDTLEKLAIGDKVLIKAYGMGLELLNFKEIKVLNISPDLLERICEEDEEKNTLKIRVRKEIPPELMGSGIGVISSSYVDYDIMTSDEETLEEYGLWDLKLGDIVAIRDHFSSFGPCYKKGAITIGVVVHGDSKISGHGPGVLPIISSPSKEKIEIIFEEYANIGFYLNCGTFRK